LGLVESEDEEEPKKVEGKLTTWKRMRCGHEKPDCGKKVDSANPIQKQRQQFKDFVMKSGDPGNTHYLGQKYILILKYPFFRHSYVQ
jgi:hypothetical protein